MQTDVTLRVAAEKSLAEFTDGQLSLLEGMFPRHVLHHMTVHGHVSVAWHAPLCMHCAVQACCKYMQQLPCRFMQEGVKIVECRLFIFKPAGYAHFSVCGESGESRSQA